MIRRIIIFLIILFIGYYCYEAFYKPKAERDGIEMRTDGDAPQGVQAEEEQAVDDGKHLTFKGVPINGSLKQFLKNMQRKGFTVEDKDDENALLSGDFASFKNCRVYVSTMKQRDLVCRIGVAFPEQETWRGLYGDYKTLKGFLTQKYGAPTKCVERFQGYGTPNDDRMRIYEAGMGRCEYYATYDIAKGTIKLSIYSESYKTYVVLTYTDKINNSIVTSDAIDDL